MCDNGDGKPVARGGLCWACLKQRQRTGSTARKQRRERHEKPLDALLEAVLALGDVEEGEVSPRDRNRLTTRLRMSYIRFWRARRKSNIVHKTPEHSP